MRWRRYEALILLALPIAWSVLVFAPSYGTDPDSYFHVACAKRLVAGGCLRTLPWLPYTSIADPFPNMFLGQHVVLAPIALLFGPALALRVGILFVSSALAASLAIVLRRHGVARPAPWVALGLLAMPTTLVYAVYLKGATTFFVVMIWFVDAAWSGARRRTFVLAWVSVYCYVGAAVLVPFVIALALAHRATGDRWRVDLIVATLAGLAVGMILHPGWPAQWSYVWRELASINADDPRLIAGDFKGAEWAPMSGALIASMAGPALIAWGVVIVRRLGEAPRVAPGAIASAVIAFAMFGASLVGGSKPLQLFALFTLIALPVIAHAQTWPRWVPMVAALVAAALCVRNVARLRAEMDEDRALGVHPDDYAALASWLDERTSPNEVVVAPWDDFPGLFLFGADERYVAGWNTRFLLEGDDQRFTAYYLLYHGDVADPEALLPRIFDGARFLIVRRDPRTPGEAKLAASLEHDAHMESVASPSPVWRVYRVAR